MSKNLSLDELQELASSVLTAANVSLDNATITARALVAAEADGLSSHGLARLPHYADQALANKVDGCVKPEVSNPAAAVVRVDAHYGFAYPAIQAGFDAALAKLSDTGLMAVAVANSHHFGVAGYHVETIAEQGYIALAFSNSPAAIAPWGGSQGSFGTNPIAFACPREQAPPLVVDLSLSQVARGKIMLAAKQDEAIPESWAFDSDGAATTDAKAALAGTMAPMGSAKGAALALMVEILTAGLTGSNYAFQASSFFDAEGPPPGIGQLFLLLNPAAFSAGFGDHLEVLMTHMLEQEGVRLPGARRLEIRARAKAEGVGIPLALYEELVGRCKP